LLQRKVDELARRVACHRMRYVRVEIDTCRSTNLVLHAVVGSALIPPPGSRGVPLRTDLGRELRGQLECVSPRYHAEPDRPGSSASSGLTTVATSRPAWIANDDRRRRARVRDSLRDCRRVNGQFSTVSRRAQDRLQSRVADWTMITSCRLRNHPFRHGDYPRPPSSELPYRFTKPATRRAVPLDLVKSKRALPMSSP